jgi:hypothetical protein
MDKTVLGMVMIHHIGFDDEKDAALPPALENDSQQVNAIRQPAYGQSIVLSSGLDTYL